MNIKTFFNKISERREERTRHKILLKAVDAGDIDAMHLAVKNGAKPSFTPKGGKQMALGHTLQRNDGAMAEALLSYGDVGISASFWHYDFRNFGPRRSDGGQLYFATSFLYSAIELGKDKVALALVKNPYVDVESAGEIIGDRTYKDEAERLLSRPLALARTKQMWEVAAAIEQRLQPLLAQQEETKAAQLIEAAAKKRAEADALEKQAEDLRRKVSPPPSLPEKPVAKPIGGFKL